MKASDVIAAIERRAHPDEELELFIVTKDKGRTVAVDLDKHASAMEKLLNLFNRGEKRR